jgi:phage gp36-like protein
MTYCTLTDIRGMMTEDILIRMTNDEEIAVTLIDPDNPAHASMVGRINAAIAKADSTIDSKLRDKYNLPLSPLPDVIRDCAVDIAIYNIYTRKMPEAPPSRKDRHDEAIRTLERIADGKQSIGENTPPDEQTETIDSISNSKTLDDRVFTKESLGGF